MLLPAPLRRHGQQVCITKEGTESFIGEEFIHVCRRTPRGTGNGHRLPRQHFGSWAGFMGFIDGHQKVGACAEVVGVGSVAKHERVAVYVTGWMVIFVGLLYY